LKFNISILQDNDFGINVHLFKAIYTMRMKFYFRYCAFLLLAGILGCQPRKNYVVKVKLVKITADDMYNSDAVSDFLFDSEEMNVDSLKNRSHQLFLHGIDLYKNKKDPAAAIEPFRQSILKYPDAKTYYELGCALLDANSNAERESESQHSTGISEAKKSLEMAENLNFQPKYMINYQMACNDYLENGLEGYDESQGDDEEGWPQCITDLYEAFNNGFTDTAMLRADKRINKVLETKSYKRMYIQAFASKTGAKPQTLFDLYKKAFPQIQQPFEIKPEQVGMGDYKQTISYEFVKFIPEMENTSFGRSVSNDYFYVGRVAETPLYTALIYSSISFMGEEMQPVYTKLVTYTPEGKIIDTRIFACQASIEKIKTGKIENNRITLEDFKRTWKYPIDKVPIDSNKVANYESISKATFILNDSGRIVPVSVPANYHDSTVAVSNSIIKK
jgi:tetratricopeptide (TPR) repeat protein